MLQRELYPGIKSSVLGFGCAPVQGSVSSKKVSTAISVAMEFGVNHFDLARSYGYGEAERFMGRFFSKKRQEIVIASKFGIKANYKAKVLAPFKPALRYIKSKVGKSKGESTLNLSSPSNVIADSFHDRVPMDAKHMQKSLEESLRALRTDYLDYFFVHEPLEALLNINELMELSEKLKGEGKIRAFGLAFMKSQMSLHKSYLNKFDILQFNNSPGSSDYDLIEKEGLSKPNIFFSPLRDGGENLSPAEKLITLVNDFPNSIVLNSMFTERHIVSNCKLFL
jgi:aryl-alcohol dehydrogenase-like predicted oxidoreductase